jgi:tetratricopeptide (TPR) repeat protein
MQTSSFDSFRAVAPSLIPKIVLIGEFGELLAKRIGEFVENFKIGEPGAIAGRYIYDAVLALLFAANELDNPRREEWTRILARYEFERRIDGNNEAMLLEPPLLRSCIDHDEFLKMVRGFGAGLGQLDKESTPSHLHLLETVERIFPGEGQELLQPELVSDSMSDSDVLAWSTQLFHKVEANLDEAGWMTISALLRGLQRRRPTILEPAIRDMWSEAAKRLDPARRIRFARGAIEFLNLARRFGYAREIAQDAEALLGDAKELSPFDRSTFLNEIGNCLRYKGEFAEALQRYEAAEAELGADDGRNKRVVMRNRAIVLRSMQRYSEAREVFAQLRSETWDLERLQSVISEALCLMEMGERKVVLALLDEHAHLADGLGGQRREWREFTSLRMQLMDMDHQREKAEQLASQLLEASKNADDPFNVAVATCVLLDSVTQETSEEERSARTDQAIATLRQAVTHARHVQGSPDVLLGLTERLNNTLIRLGKLEEAEQVVREAIDAIDPQKAPRGWLLCLFALRHALRRNDIRSAVGDALVALTWLDESLVQAAATSDVIALLAPYADEVAEVVELIIIATVEARPAMQEIARAAADLIAAPLLTARVRARLGVGPPTRDLQAQLTQLNNFQRETPVVCIQTVKLSHGIGLLISSSAQSDSLQSVLRILEIDADEVDATLRRLDFHLRHISPTARSLSLDDVRGWSEFVEAFRASTSELTSDMPLCIVPGPLSSLPFSLVFGSERPACFAPSLGLLLALRERRRCLPGGLAWRPQNMFDFAVWRMGDKPAVAQALRMAASQGMIAARNHGLFHNAKIGTEADGPALLAGLSRADLTRLACHGRILPNQDAVDILVAADGLLPPAAAAALESSGTKAHVLGWQRLADLESASPIVIASACDSGAAILHAGGERLGLERPLFGAGTIAFVAPQWPVPAVATQRFFSIFLDQYLDDPTRPLATILVDTKKRAIAAGLPPLAVEAPAVFGDGL